MAIDLRSQTANDLGCAVSPKVSSEISAMRIAGNSLWSVLGWFCGLVLSFVAAPILIALLGAEHYGLLALLTSLVAPMGLLDFGVSEATVKYVAEAIGRKNFNDVGRYVRSSLVFNLCVGFLGGGTIILLSDFLTTSLFRIPAGSQGLARNCLYWIGLTWVITQARQTFIGTVTAMQRYDVLNMATFIYQAVMTLVGIGVLWFGGSLLHFIQAQAALGLVASAAWLALAKHLLPEASFLPKIDWPALQKTMHFGSWQVLSNAGGLLAHQSQRWLLGVLMPVASVGFYNVSFQLASMVYMLTYRMGQVLFPAISQMQGESREDEAARLTIQASWVLSTLGISCLVAVAVFSHDILRLWINQDYANEASGVMKILCAGVAVGCVFATHSFYLLGTGRNRWLALLAFAQGLVTCISCAVLIPRIGLEGAGWGLTLGTVAQLVFLIYLWKEHFSQWIPSDVYFSATFGQCAVGGVLVVVLIQVRETLAWSPGWLSLAAAASLVAITCGIAILTLDSLMPGGVARRQLAMRLGLLLRPFPAWRIP